MSNERIKPEKLKENWIIFITCSLCTFLITKKKCINKSSLLNILSIISRAISCGFYNLRIKLLGYFFFEDVNKNSLINQCSIWLALMRSRCILSFFIITYSSLKTSYITLIKLFANRFLSFKFKIHFLILFHRIFYWQFSSKIIRALELFYIVFINFTFFLYSFHQWIKNHNNNQKVNEQREFLLIKKYAFVAHSRIDVRDEYYITWSRKNIKLLKEYKKA